MKKYTVIFVCFLVSMNAYSQRAVLSFNKMNILYIGIDNPIELAGNNIDCKSVKFETHNMSLNFQEL